MEEAMHITGESLTKKQIRGKSFVTENVVVTPFIQKVIKIYLYTDLAIKYVLWNY